MDWKTLGIKLTTAILTGDLAFQTPVQLIAQAASTPEYLSEVIISYGSSDEEARNGSRTTATGS
ncbi:MAG: hypothetical protein K5695_14265 [Oscillospiraceae bacterium]|nr:hypothetical protein [Oscillospiraceae bacterium]